MSFSTCFLNAADILYSGKIYVPVSVDNILNLEGGNVWSTYLKHDVKLVYKEMVDCIGGIDKTVYMWHVKPIRFEFKPKYYKQTNKLARDRACFVILTCKLEQDSDDDDSPGGTHTNYTKSHGNAPCSE